MPGTSRGDRKRPPSPGASGEDIAGSGEFLTLDTKLGAAGLDEDKSLDINVIRFQMRMLFGVGEGDADFVVVSYSRDEPERIETVGEGAGGDVNPSPPKSSRINVRTLAGPLPALKTWART